ncbi:hypothetical protein AWC38_SpisGene23443 [Stylophora pistillata]|uniref:SWIM-type domain-containing protein n=1 Tax=Stylophora pistillata TaxID=50429 RepID=A0A2B4R8H3_STYPI|nr:hypothetical protein AWC38_SpisGene23443 [Stylophora pistillata]
MKDSCVFALDRHNKSKGLREEMITKVDNCKWSVQSGDNQSVYTVTREMEVCRDPSCDLRCLECNICIHQYMCSCPDSLIQSTICKHVHLIETVISAESTPAELSCDIELTGTLDDKRSKYVDQELHVLAEHAMKTDSLSDIATHREKKVDHNHNEMFHWFGIEQAKIKQYTTTRKNFFKEDKVLDEDHPQGEALASDLNDIKQFFTPDAWNMTNKSSVSKVLGHFFSFDLSTICDQSHNMIDQSII